MQTQELIDPSTIKAMHLGHDDINVAASLLYNAYFDDPLFVDIFQSHKDGYESRLRSAIREELNIFWDAGHPMIGLFDNERLLAVACLSEPTDDPSAGRFWHWRLKMLLTAGLFGTRQMLEKEERVRDLIPASHFHMIGFIAVHPDHQHLGLGHVLMGAIDSLLLESEDSEGVAVFVTVPKYQTFFADGDYAVVDNLSIGKIVGQVMFRSRPV